MEFTDLYPISKFAIVQVIFLAILLFLGFRLLKRLLEKLIRFRTHYISLLRLYSMTELIVWLVFIYWAFHKVFGINQIFVYSYLAVLIAVFIWTFWFALKDLIAGVVLKTQDIYRPAQIIKLENIEGKIRSIGHLSMDVELIDGDIIKLPFSKIAGQVHVKSETKLQNRLHTFGVQVSKSHPVNETVDHLRFLILTLPWVTQNAEPLIQLKSEDEGFYHFDISVHTISTRFHSNLEKSLNNIAI